jgi:hypothetical protein
MKISKLLINRGAFSPIEIDFLQNTVITSDDNAKGKTTLVRFLLHSLGYKIPSTKKVNLMEHETILQFKNDKSLLVVKRDKNLLEIKYSNGIVNQFDLTDDRNRLIAQSIIFNTENYDFLRNLLMIIYIDQDKGWTLLNRGKAIGNNRFDVNDFIAALSGIDVSRINHELKNLDIELEKYKSIKKIISLKENLKPVEYAKKIDQEGIDDKNRLLTIKSEFLNRKQRIEAKIRSFKKIQKSNKEMIDYLVSYKLLIKDKNGNQFVLSQDNIVDFDIDQNILDFQIKSEYLNLDEVKRDIVEIESKLKVYAQLFDVDDNTSNIINSIITTDIEAINIDRVLTSLGKQKSILKKQKNEMVSARSNLIDKTMKLVEKFTSKLGVYKEFIETEKNYLFTSNLKEYSGSILHKIVFSYRLAFNITASETVGVTLPFIIDSPGSAELTMENIRELILLAKESLPNSQIIISTIYRDIVSLFDSEIKNIHLENMLFDNDKY